MSDLPPYLRPFLLEPPECEVETLDDVDFYLPAGTDEAPVVVLVHGGPIKPDRPVGPRDWPAYRGYGRLLATAGVVGAMFEHPFREDGDDALMYPALLALVERARRHPRVDPDRVVVWFFSGGGYFLGSLLHDRPEWLRAVAATYPYLGSSEEGLVPALAACAEGLPVPLLLTTVELEHDWCADTQAAFLAEITDTEVIHVPGAHHGFETVDHTDEAREAVGEAVGWVSSRA